MRMRLTLLSLLLASVFLPAQVKVTQDADHVKVEIDGKPFTTFYLHEGDAMKPFLYPLLTADGKVITRHFPMEKVEGETTTDLDHRGMWLGVIVTVMRHYIQACEQSVGRSPCVIDS